MDPLTAYTVPSASPLYPPPPYRYRDSPMTIVPFVAGAGVLERLVPEPLQPNGAGIAAVAIGHLHNHALGSTREAFVVVPCSDGERDGNYAAFLYLENDACVTSGREIWGWPKKLAEIEYADTPAGVSATVHRAGSTVIEVGLRELVDASPDDLGLSPIWFNLKVIPSVVADAPPEVCQVTATTFEGLEARDVRRGRATLRIADGRQDALATILDPGEVMDGHRMTLSFDLLHGEVVHDHLAAPRREVAALAAR